MLPLIAKSTDLPLYTGLIKGKAVDQGPEYGDRSQGGERSGTSGDETEDLTKLLEKVMVRQRSITHRCDLTIRQLTPMLPLWLLELFCRIINGYESNTSAVD
jgi:hypothetical protein